MLILNCFDREYGIKCVKSITKLKKITKLMCVARICECEQEFLTTAHSYSAEQYKREREREKAAVNESTAAREVHRSTSHHHSLTQQCYIKPVL